MMTYGMIRGGACALAAALLLSAGAGRATAQPAAAAGRAFIDVGFGMQSETPAFSVTTSDRVYAEDASFQMRYGAKGGSVFEVGGGARVWRNVWAGVAFTPTSHEHDVEFSGSIPHPLHFDDPRALSGERTGLERKESSVHVQVIYRLQVAPRIRVAVMAGPSWINASQDLIDKVSVEESYPFDSVTLAGSSLHRDSVTKQTIGFGASVHVNVAGPVAVGLRVRRAAATVDFEDSTGGTTRAKVGGTQVLGGVSLTF